MVSIKLKRCPSVELQHLHNNLYCVYDDLYWKWDKSVHVLLCKRRYRYSVLYWTSPLNCLKIVTVVRNGPVAEHCIYKSPPPYIPYFYGVCNIFQPIFSQILKFLTNGGGYSKFKPAELTDFLLVEKYLWYQRKWTDMTSNSFFV